MGVSKNRKAHKAKVQEYKNRIAGEKKRAQEALMKMYQEQMAFNQSQLKQQVNGLDVENTDIDVDLGDLNIMEVPQVDVETPVEEVVVETPVEEVVVEKNQFTEKLWEFHPENPKNKKVEQPKTVVKEESKGFFNKSSSKKTSTNKKK